MQTSSFIGQMSDLWMNWLDWCLIKNISQYYLEGWYLLDILLSFGIHNLTKFEIVPLDLKGGL